MEIQTSNFIVVDCNSQSTGIGQIQSFNNPFKTISEAFKHVQDNDLVIIRGGDYYETPDSPYNLGYDLQYAGAKCALIGKNNVTIQGWNNPRLNLLSHGNGFYFENCTNLRISGVEINGQGYLAQPLNVGFCLIHFAGTNDNILIENCKFRDSGNHGVAHLLGPRTTTNVTVRDCLFERAGHMQHPTLGRDGCAVGIAGNGNRFVNNTIREWLRGIEIESGSFGNRDTENSKILIQGNLFERCWWQAISIMPTHARTGWINRVKIVDNLFEGWGQEPSPKFGKEHFAHCAVYLGGASHFQICGNTISKMWDGPGIQCSSDFAAIESGMIHDNHVFSVDRHGICLIRTNNPITKMSVCSNLVEMSGASDFYFDGVQGLNLQGNIGDKPVFQENII